MSCPWHQNRDIIDSHTQVSYEDLMPPGNITVTSVTIKMPGPQAGHGPHNSGPGPYPGPEHENNGPVIVRNHVLISHLKLNLQF